MFNNLAWYQKIYRGLHVNGGHIFFLQTKLILSLLFAILIHLLLLTLPLGIESKKTNASNKNMMDVFISKSLTISDNERASHEDTPTSVPLTRQQNPDNISGIVVGKPTGLGMGLNSPVEQKAFSRDKQRRKSQITAELNAKKNALRTRNSQPPMQAIWTIVQKSQQFYPGGENISCFGGPKFVCRPFNESLARFFEGQWTIMQMSFRNMPAIELGRESGYWRLRNIY